jgi:hypothetical protein
VHCVVNSSLEQQNLKRECSLISPHKIVGAFFFCEKDVNIMRALGKTAVLFVYPHVKRFRANMPPF